MIGQASHISSSAHSDTIIVKSQEHELPTARSRSTSAGKDSESDTDDWSMRNTLQEAHGLACSQLPDYEYPTPFIVRNTFIDTPVLRPYSLDEFLHERRIQSSPVEIQAAPISEAETLTIAPMELRRAVTTSAAVFASAAADASAAASAAAASVRSWWATPEWSALPSADAASPSPSEWPTQPDTVAASQSGWPTLSTTNGQATGWPLVANKVAQSNADAASLIGWPALPNAVEPNAAQCKMQEPPPPAPALSQLLRLADAIKEPELGSLQLPTVGSVGHYAGICKPCAFFYKQGCGNGVQCPFCHLCDSGEKKRRQKDKMSYIREMRRVGL